MLREIMSNFYNSEFDYPHLFIKLQIVIVLSHCSQSKLIQQDEPI